MLKKRGFETTRWSEKQFYPSKNRMVERCLLRSDLSLSHPVVATKLLMAAMWFHWRGRGLALRGNGCGAEEYALGGRRLLARHEHFEVLWGE